MRRPSVPQELAEEIAFLRKRQAAEKAPEIHRVDVLELQPHDVAILHYPGRLTNQQVSDLRQQLRAVLGGDRMIIVLDNGARLDFARPAP